MIAEFGWPSAGYNLQRRRSRPHRAGARAARLRRPRRAPTASTTTSSKPSISRGRPSKAASAPIGACSTPSRQPKFAWTGPITDPDHWKLAGIAVLLGVLLSLPILALAGATLARPRCSRPRANMVGAWFAIVFAYLERPLFRARRGLRARARHRAADPADRHRAGAHRGDRRDRVRPQAAPADRVAAAGAGAAASRRRCRSTSRPIASRRRC